MQLGKCRVHSCSCPVFGLSLCFQQAAEALNIALGQFIIAGAVPHLQRSASECRSAKGFAKRSEKLRSVDAQPVASRLRIGFSPRIHQKADEVQTCCPHQCMFICHAVACHTPRGAVKESVYWAFRFHFGSLAFGSFILAVVQFIRYVLPLSSKGQAQGLEWV